MNNKYIYLVAENDDLSLPVGTFDTASDVALFLGTHRVYVEFLIRWGTAYRGKYLVFRLPA